LFQCSSVREEAFSKMLNSWVQCLMPIIPATWGVEGGSRFMASSCKKLVRPYLNKITQAW
jgi:hypothetical protein